MASKRRLRVAPPPEAPEPEGEWEDDRDVSIEGTWEDWFYRVFLKYMYAVVVLFAACLLPLESMRSLQGDLGLAGAFISLLTVIPLGAWGFIRLWGAGGRWGSEPSD